MYKQKIPRQW